MMLDIIFSISCEHHLGFVLAAALDQSLPLQPTWESAAMRELIKPQADLVNIVVRTKSFGTASRTL